MHAVVIFINIGFYHAARLRATFDSFSELGWRLTSMQLTDNTLEHPWGNADEIITFPVITLAESSASEEGRTRIPEVSADKVARELGTLRPDVVFLPGWSFPICITVLQWCRQNNIPAVVMSESKRDDEKRIWWRERLKSLFYVRKFSAALVGGAIHVDYVASLGLDRDSIFTGYDAVDNDHFWKIADVAREDEIQTRERCPSIPPRPYFLAVLRLIPRKNVARLLEAYARYRNSPFNGRWDLVICGEGEEKKRLQKTVCGMNLDGYVHFPGFVSYKDMGYWYGLAEAFIHPALNEQWGLVVNEACAAGLPIICSSTVGARYDLVRENKNGFLFSPEDGEELTKCLIRMSTASPEDRKQLGDESRAIVRSCSPATFADGFVAAARAATKNVKRSNS